ncbi:P-type conjugative transfer protein TrbL, partial [Pseudomonas sp.]
IRFIMVIGFFYALLLFSAEWAEALVNSFREAGANAAGLDTKGLKPGDIFATAVDLANTVGSVETWNPLTSTLLSLAALIVLLCFAFIAAFMGLTIIESFVVINASSLFMGFGASQWTREYSMAIVRYAVSVGAKLFVLTLIVGLIVDSAKAWAAAYNAAADDASMWTMVGLSLACAYLAKTIPELVAGMISGSSSGGGSSLGGMAAAAVAGAAAAAATIATAGAAGAAGAIGGSAMGAGSAGAAGGSLGSGGLAGAINSSFAGAGGGASAAGGGASSAGLGASTGGSTAAQTAGAKVGGGSASGGPSAPAPSQSSQASEGVQKAATQASKAAQGNNESSSAQPQAAPQSIQGGDSPQGMAPSAGDAKESSNGVSAHQVANALTRGAGILSAISVPGMEGAAGLSLGAGAPQPSPGAGGGESMEVNGADMQTDVQNVIRPAEPPAMPNT